MKKDRKTGNRIINVIPKEGRVFAIKINELNQVVENENNSLVK